MKTTELFQVSLESGNFSSVTARRLRNIVSECFAPRYLVEGDYPASILKTLNSLPSNELSQLFYLFTARANLIFEDYVKSVYWRKYLGGQEFMTNEDSRSFVVEANMTGKTVKPWSESTIKRVSSYILGCCVNFGLIQPASKGNYKINSFRPTQRAMAFLAYDLHFAGLGDGAVIGHSDWELFGLQKEDVREELKRLSLKGYFIVQSAGELIRIGWNYKTWEELANVIIKG